uniref:Uncharacterized protein n=1 Tax=Glossina brevipalpis TaxID=37001 RepID=A0A1A9WP23_9MUSC
MERSVCYIKSALVDTTNQDHSENFMTIKNTSTTTYCRDLLREFLMQNIEKFKVLNHDHTGLLKINKTDEAHSSTRFNADKTMMAMKRLLGTLILGYQIIILTQVTF